jgi:hypothetical protein
MIHENSPVTNAFVSVPADMGQFNCAAFLAGVLAGMLDSARFVSDDDDDDDAGQRQIRE